MDTLNEKKPTEKIEKSDCLLKKKAIDWNGFAKAILDKIEQLRKKD